MYRERERSIYTYDYIHNSGCDPSQRRVFSEGGHIIKDHIIYHVSVVSEFLYIISHITFIIYHVEETPGVHVGRIWETYGM